MIRNMGIIGTLIAIVIVLAGCGALGQSAGPVVIAPTTITLHYDESGLIMQNTGANPMGAPDRLDFVRGLPGSDNDDYNAARISGGLAPNQCYALVRRNGSPPPIEACAGTVSTEVIPSTPDMFWRAEPIQVPIFNIQWDGVTIHECETFSIVDADVKTCTFTYPPQPDG
jgi:hypothetical protein